MSLGSTGIIVMGICVGLAAYDYRVFRSAMVTDTQTYANIVAGNSTAALAFGDRNDAAQTLASMRFEPHVVAACLYDATGKQFATYDRNSGVPFPRPIDLRPGDYRFSGERLEVSCPVILNGQTLGAAYIQSDLTALHQRCGAGTWWCMGPP